MHLLCSTCFPPRPLKSLYKLLGRDFSLKINNFGFRNTFDNTGVKWIDFLKKKSSLKEYFTNIEFQNIVFNHQISNTRY